MKRRIEEEDRRILIMGRGRINNNNNNNNRRVAVRTIVGDGRRDVCCVYGSVASQRDLRVHKLDQFRNIFRIPGKNIQLKMAKKTWSRGYKDGGNQGRKQQVISDEITLRDEILDLKREIMILRRTNEQYSVRLRKYEDEAKRKDKQLEQLMNPRKNADITKVLSTKGAAILMNLKDQNNALIQMLLNKDVQIRRLVAEVKMSKLYASSKRNECYKAEISRLRNLVIKSEEALKENAEVHEEQTRSICVSGNPIWEFCSSSDQSSPRDLDELRCTILSLETHIKYSNDLLAQKNKQISLLSDELNFLRRYFRYKTSKAEMYDTDYSPHHKLSSKAFTRSWPDPLNSKQLSSQDLLDLFDKQQNHDYSYVSRSAPASSTFVEPKYLTAEPPTSHTKKAADGEHLAVMNKSLFHSLVADELIKEEKMVSKNEKPLRTKEKWKKAMAKCKELRNLRSGPTTDGEENRKRISENETSLKFLKFEAHESKQTGKDVEKVKENSEDDEENANEIVPKSESQKESDSLNPFITKSSYSADNTDMNDNDISWQTLQSYSSILNNGRKCSAAESGSNDASQNVSNTGSPHAEVELNISPEISSGQRDKRKSLRDVYYHSSDSSCDSESGYGMNREVQVEVQINSVPLENYNEQSEDSGSERVRVNEFCKILNENHHSEFEFNDDDDVIVR